MSHGCRFFTFAAACLAMGPYVLVAQGATCFSSTTSYHILYPSSYSFLLRNSRAWPIFIVNHSCCSLHLVTQAILRQENKIPAWVSHRIHLAQWHVSTEWNRARISFLFSRSSGPPSRSSKIGSFPHACRFTIQRASSQFFLRILNVLSHPP
jgi:hypothetical protein